MGENFSFLYGVQNGTQNYPVPYLKVNFVLSAGQKQRSVKKTSTHHLLPRLNEWNFVPINLSFFFFWSIALYGAETWTLRAVDQKHLESFEMWCWRMMEKISWTDHVRNEDVLLRVKEQRNILHEIRKRKANWIDHILRRNCLLQRVTEG